MELELYLMGGGGRGRYYDPATGRFINQDPSGLAGGDTNLYRYVNNNPVNAVDPSGNWQIDLDANEIIITQVGPNGDRLWNIARELTGSGANWERLFPSVVGQETRLQIGQRIPIENMDLIQWSQKLVTDRSVGWAEQVQAAAAQRTEGSAAEPGGGGELYRITAEEWAEFTRYVESNPELLRELDAAFSSRAPQIVADVRVQEYEAGEALRAATPLFGPYSPEVTAMARHLGMSEGRYLSRNYIDPTDSVWPLTGVNCARCHWPVGAGDGLLANQRQYQYDLATGVVSKPSFSWPTFSPTTIGWLQTIGGIIEGAGGAVLAAGGGPFAPLGVILMVHGADTASTGIQTLRTGAVQRTRTSHDIENTARYFGADPATAQQIGETGDLVVSMVDIPVAVFQLYKLWKLGGVADNAAGLTDDAARTTTQQADNAAGVSDEAARVVQGLSSDAADAALDGMRTGGGHAMRYLVGNLIPDTGTLADRLAKFKQIAGPILRNPEHVAPWRIGATNGTAYLGSSGGRKIVIIVADDGPYVGKVISAIFPDSNQLRLILGR